MGGRDRDIRHYTNEANMPANILDQQWAILQ